MAESRVEPDRQEQEQESRVEKFLIRADKHWYLSQGSARFLELGVLGHSITWNFHVKAKHAREYIAWVCDSFIHAWNMKRRLSLLGPRYQTFGWGEMEVVRLIGVRKLYFNSAGEVIQHYLEWREE